LLGLGKRAKNKILKTISNLFDDLAYEIVGNVPSLKGKKKLFFGTRKPLHTLAHLFVQSLGNRKMTGAEKKVLSSNLESAIGYVDALKSKAQNQVFSRLDGYAKTQQVKGRSLDRKDIESIVDQEMSKVGSHLKTITNAEATRTRNTGAGMDILNVAKDQGVGDPTVFFVVIRDSVTCKVCLGLHLLPDMITPRLWKFSELSQDYHKKGDGVPSIHGEHPHCRCTLSVLSPGFGFDKSGHAVWVRPGHDEFKRQREKFGMPPAL